MLRFNAELIADYTKRLALEPNNIYFYDFRAKAYLNQGEFGKAIADYSKILELDSDNSFYAVLRRQGAAHFAEEKLARLMAGCAEALKHNQRNPKSTEAFNILMRIFNCKDEKIFFALSKEKLFETIKSLPRNESLNFLVQCLDKKTTLGKRFWERDGLRDCSLESGTLSDIIMHIKMLIPGFVVPVSVTTNSIFVSANFTEVEGMENKRSAQLFCL